MKQLLPLFLFFLPCLAWAQYPSNGNQKITLGEQTSADGLIYRGVAATDTVRKPSVDTMAYMVLDTTTNIIWHYKKATSNAWLRVGGSISSGLTGTLPVANGGTNTTTLTANKVMVGNGTSAVLTPTNLHWDNTNSRLGINQSSPTERLHVQGNSLISGSLFAGTNSRFIGDGFQLKIGYDNVGGGFYFADGNDNANYKNWRIGTSIFLAGSLSFSSSTTNGGTTFSEPSFLFTDDNKVLFGYTSNIGNYRLQCKDSVYVGGNVSAAAYTTRSDYNLKDDIFDLKYGLNDVLQLQPVEYTYKSNGSKQLGFIAQDIGTILPEVVSFEESMSVNYQAIIPILTKAIQEQNSLIKALEQRIINLENK
jgi:hypothetical protein